MGRYQLTGTLGRGAMGVVYEAIDPALARPLAIKTLQGTVNTDEYIRRFRTEARAAGRLSHPNIVTIYDIGEADGVTYIAMELVRGQELHAVLKAGAPLPLARSLHIVDQLLSALEYAHDGGVLHRDIKPANVMLTESGDVKLTDFGIARIADAQNERTQAGTLLGTPSYMAPEQLRGLPTDPRADLFATGVILYELLAGRRPFTADSTVALMHKILNEDPVPPSQVNPDVPKRLDAIVLRALEKAPERRYASAADFRAALSSPASPVSAGSPAAPAPVTAASGRGLRWLFAALAGGLRRTGAPPMPTPATTAHSPPSPAPAPPPPPGPAPDWNPFEGNGEALHGDRTLLAGPGAAGQAGFDPTPPRPPGDQTLLISPASASPADGGPVSLLVVRSEVAAMVGQRFAVGAETRIGRTGADIALPDALLSRQHAVVRRGEQGVTITDLGSVNGTHVNGFRLQPDRPYPLLPGAHVGVGATVLALAIDTQASMAGLAGRELAGRYALQECLHASPKGALYRAQKKGSQMAVAVKLLAPAYSQWPGYRDSFTAEAEIAASLQHPHICRLEDHGEGDLVLERDEPPQPVPFLVYEIMAGGSLRGRLTRLAELPTATLVAWVHDLASALDHVHRKGLVHGGLKPSAVCFDADDHVYLTDFAHGRSQPDRPGIFGAPAYMAPELWQGEAAGAASDQYALGVIAYLLLAGVLPFEGQEDPAARARNGQRPPRALHPGGGGRTLGPAVTAAVNRALATHPAQRYPSAAEFAQQLARAVSNAGRAAWAHPVFISYERATATAWVTLISQELSREYDVRCFVDAASLDRAESFPARIREAIRDCEVFVCILGPSTLQSKWVREEIASAWRYRKTMVPVLLEGFTESAEDLKVRSIRALLHYGGERVLDRQNLFVREAMQRIAQRVKSGLADDA